MCEFDSKMERIGPGLAIPQIRDTLLTTMIIMEIISLNCELINNMKILMPDQNRS